MHSSIAAVLLATICYGAASKAWGAEGAVPGQEVVMRAEALWPAGVPGALGTAEADRPEVTLHLPLAGQGSGAAMVVCPGGGYAVLMLICEGHDIVRRLNAHGVAALVL